MVVRASQDLLRKPDVLLRLHRVHGRLPFHGVDSSKTDERERPERADYYKGISKNV